MKTHVITFSKTFMKGHPKAGEPTGFRGKILTGEKIHTIRSNYEYWKPKIEQVQDSEAILSLRYWKGKPYRSKQEEFRKIDWSYDLGFQKVLITGTGTISVDDKVIPSGYVIANDGLTVSEFDNWFPDEKFNGIIIHFTDFRY